MTDNTKTSDNSTIDRMAVAISGAPFPSTKSRKKAFAILEAMKVPFGDNQFDPTTQAQLNNLIQIIIQWKGVN